MSANISAHCGIATVPILHLIPTLSLVDQDALREPQSAVTKQALTSNLQMQTSENLRTPTSDQN